MQSCIFSQCVLVLEATFHSNLHELKPQQLPTRLCQYGSRLELGLQLLQALLLLSQASDCSQ